MQLIIMAGYSFCHGISLSLILVALVNDTKGVDVGECEVSNEGNQCFDTSAHWQHDGVCIEDRCYVPDTRSFRFTLRISIKILRLFRSIKRLDKLWIRGVGPGFSNDHPIALRKSASGVGLWTTEVTYRYDSEGILCNSKTHCSANQLALEFRVYQNEAGSEDMIGPNMYVSLPVPVSMEGSDYFLPPNVDVYPWFGGRTITIEEFRVLATSSIFTEFKGQILYPPSFEYNLRRKYPVIILFGTRIGPQIVSLLENMYVNEASIHEALVITLYYNDSAPFCAFNPYSADDDFNLIWKCKSEEYCRECFRCWESRCSKEQFIDRATNCLYPMKCNGYGEDVLDVVEEHVIPEVAEKMTNRLLIDFPRNRLTIIGFDGAGLLACHAAVSRPNVYQNAACLSAPLHWPLKSLVPTGADETGMGKLITSMGNRFTFYPDNRSFHATQKYYIDYGEFDNHHFRTINTGSYVDWFVSKLKDTLGVPLENIFHLRNVLKSSNNYYFAPEGGMEILNRIKIPLLFFFRIESGPNVVFPHTSVTSGGSVLSGPPKSDSKNHTEYSEECITKLQILQQREKRIPGVPMEIFIITIRK